MIFAEPMRIRWGEHKPWEKSQLPPKWINKYFDGFACDIEPSGFEEPTEDEELCIKVIHFIHVHRWHSVDTLCKELHTYERRLDILESKFIIHC